MASYVWGSQPPITISVTDNIYHAPGSTAYSGYVTVSGSFGSDHTWTYDYWIDVTVNGTTKRLKTNTSGSITWSNTVTFYVSGNTPASSIDLAVVVSTQSPYRNSLDASYTTNIGSYSPPVTEPASVPTLSTYSAKLGNSITIYTNRRSNSYTHTLSYAVGAKTGTIGTDVTTSSAWTVPTSLIDDVTSAGTTCVITCTTYYDGPIVGANTVTLTLLPPDNAVPVVSSGWATLTRDNSGTGAENISEWVKGFSKGRIRFDKTKVTAQYGASIVKFAIKYNNVRKEITVGDDQYYDLTTDTISTTLADIYIYAIDSRGFSKEQLFHNLELLDYAPPTISSADVEVFRSDSLKQPDDDGHYLCAKAKAGCTSLNNKNSVTMTAAFKQSGASSFGTEVSLPANTYTIINSTEISETASYIVRITATDALGTSAAFEKTVSTKSVTFHLKNGGNGAAFGKVSETDNLLDVQWDLHVAGDVDVAGDVEVDGDFEVSGDLNVTGNISANNLNDIVIEEGTAANSQGDTWRYQKWKSGKVECWIQAKKEINPTGYSIAPGVSATAFHLIISLPSSLFADNETILAFFTETINGYSSYPGECYIMSGKKIALYALCGFENIGSREVTANIHVIGRWKS